MTTQQWWPVDATIRGMRCAALIAYALGAAFPAAGSTLTLVTPVPGTSHFWAPTTWVDFGSPGAPNASPQPGDELLVQGSTAPVVLYLGDNGALEPAQNGSALRVRIFGPESVTIDSAGTQSFPLPGALVMVSELSHIGAQTELTHAESGIACDLARGATVAAIAHRRGSSNLTVETQIKSVYAKLGVGSRVELASRLEAVSA